jgi:uncharacterized protein YndB with AHSA1/START domain
VAAVRNSVVIARPIEDVFAVLTDVEKTGTWFPGNVTEWWLTDPPHGVGSRRRARTRLGPFSMANDAVATAYDPPHHAAMRGLSRWAPFNVDLRFSRLDDGTGVVIDSTIEGGGLMRLLAPLFVRMFGRGWRIGLVRLKDLMESGEL